MDYECAKPNWGLTFWTVAGFCVVMAIVFFISGGGAELAAADVTSVS